MAFSTNKSLLTKIARGDELGWKDFYHTYFPLIWKRGREDRGLSRSETEDLVQEVMKSMFLASGKFVYSPEKGRFQDYLRRIIDRRAIDIIRKRDKAIRMTDAIDFNIAQTEPSETGVEGNDSWDEKWRSHVYKQALIDLRDRLEPKTYQAFELSMFRNWERKRVAEFLSISTGAVSVAKHRAIATLKKIVSELEEN